MAGLYVIQNKIDGMKYIGSTKRDIERRLTEHRNGLKRGQHRNRYLTAAWQKYGEDCFEFRPLREITFSTNDDIDEKLRIAEDEAFIEHNCIAPNGYNLKTAQREKLSDETKRKMSESKKGEKNYFYGKHHSEEALQKNREKNKLRRALMTNEQKEIERQKISEGVRKAKAEGRGNTGFSAEAIAKSLETKRKRGLTEKELEARRAALKKIHSLPHSNEQKRKMSEARKAWWANKTEKQLEEIRKKASEAACKKPRLTDEQKKQRGEVSKKMWEQAGPERREAARQRMIIRNKNRSKKAQINSALPEED